MTPEHRDLLRRWAAQAQDRGVIEEFLEWRQENGCSIQATMAQRDALDRYFQIDRVRLDEARRALLEEATSPAGEEG